MYDEKIKAELFSIADFSFQPAWTGLSVVESFAHGVPYITLKKAHDIHQCVEYNYIIHGFNGFIANNIKSVQETIRNFPETELDEMKKYCIDYVKNNLSLSKMVANFTNGLNSTFYK